MSLVVAPFAGTLEWCVEPGQSVLSRQVLGFLTVRDHCAVRPLLAPTAGLLSWRRAAELTEVLPHAVLGVLGEDPLELAQGLSAERDEVLRLGAQLLDELDRVRRRAPTALARCTATQLEASLARLGRWRVP